MRGFTIVISGPSGVGKTTICDRVLAEDPLTSYSVSVTTRPPRRGERDGEDYDFLSDGEFDALAESGELAEWAVVHGRRYGTRRSVIEEITAAGRDVLMDIDVQGGASIKRVYPESALVFVVPPSLEILEKRLRSRATDDDVVIETRLRNAREELTWRPKYDYTVINDDLDKAIVDTLMIIRAERLRTTRVCWGNETAS